MDKIKNATVNQTETSNNNLENINLETLRNMFIAGAKALEQNKELVDSLNVFPVPDGDTGTNMSLTLNSAINAIIKESNDDVLAFSQALSNGALRGARGNSGVILSQILKGMAQEFEKCENLQLTTQIFAKAFATGSQTAYKSVTQPQEGTILTVIRVIGEQANSIASNTTNLVEFFNNILQHGEIVLQQTPEMLPVLKKAGVIDAGGRGLLIIFSGMQKVLTGQWQDGYDFSDSFNNLNNGVTSNNYAEIMHFADVDSIEFAYCTEFMVSNIKSNVKETHIEQLKNKLMEIGDSVVCVGDLELVKVHVHTNEPSKALGFGLQLGELINIKIDNMKEQFRELHSNNEQDEKEFGLVSVVAGEGLNSLFKDILIDKTIKGGQTMNPSANDIANACNSIAAKTIFVFPNNKNIILSAEQAKELSSKNIIVVPTKSIPEGVAATLAFNPDETAENNFNNMVAAKNSVKSGSVTHAIRDTNINNLNISKGDIIGLDNDTILTADKSVNTATKNLIAKLVTEDSFNITVFYGNETTQQDAEILQNELQEQYSDQEIIFIDGGQPVYNYLISIE